MAMKAELKSRSISF